MNSLALANGPRRAHAEGLSTIGDVLPEFRLPPLAVGVGDGWEFDSAWLRGRWVALLYWPKESCLQSATEVAQLTKMGPAFADRETVFVAVTAAITSRGDGGPGHPASSEMPFPVLVDVRGEVAAALGIDVTGAGRAVRATFVADPSGVIRWMSASDLSAARSLQEAAQVLDTARGRRPPAGANPLIRVCAWCTRIQEDAEWLAPEDFIRRRTRTELSHGICCECLHTQLSR